MSEPNSTLFITSHHNDPRANDRWNHVEPSRKYRGAFAKDRDRILYSKGFLRLRDKTQVFMMDDLDYIRTRLTHTLEVSQIARSIATGLGLNLDLTEAIALGHDVGHTPFGHVGERTLDEFTKGKIKLLDSHNNPVEIPEPEQGFKHNLQSARVLCCLEPGTEGTGLNLTKYTLWGIIHHSSIRKEKNGVIIEYPFYADLVAALDEYWSFEGYVVALADEIAQRHHDIEDSLRYDLISREDLIESFENLTLKGENKHNYEKLKNAIGSSQSQFIALFSRFLVNMYVVDAINQIKINLKQLAEDFDIKNQTDFVNKRGEINSDRHSMVISQSHDMKTFDEAFERLLKDNVINSYSAQTLDGKGAYIIRKLFKAYYNNPCQMHDSAVRNLFRQVGENYDRSRILDIVVGNEQKLIRVIADYIAGMTDNYAYDQFDLLYGTRR